MIDFTRLKEAFDATDYEFMNEQAPDISAAIEELVKLGATPEQIRVIVQRQVSSDRQAIVLRCVGAARHVKARMVNA